ncbi:MAG TPA: hypothetical protein VMT16_02095 [Thermoanaerobaculia bacterium]|nr:hypothetical protein [Thermoanaerobaculia bacterium]
MIGGEVHSGIHRTLRAPVRELAALVEAATELEGVRRGDLRPGDRLLVATRNSIYSLVSRPGGGFEVSGGWFDRESTSPAEAGVAGCTAGGRALFSELVAAPGLFLEFANGVRTTRIRRVRLLRASAVE